MILYFFLVRSKLTRFATTDIKYFSKIDYPRQQGKVVHKLFDILFLTLSAVIADNQGWEEIADLGYDHLDWLHKFVSFEVNGKLKQ